VSRVSLINSSLEHFRCKYLDICWCWYML